MTPTHRSIVLSQSSTCVSLVCLLVALAACSNGPEAASDGVVSEVGAGSPQGGSQSQGGSLATGGDQAQGGEAEDPADLDESSAGMPAGGSGGMPQVAPAGDGGTVSGAGGSGGGASGEGGAAPGAGDPNCASGSVVCDGFESYASGSPPDGSWTPSSRGEGAIVVDTTRAFSGTQSLHVTGVLNRDHAQISMPIETESDTLHVRFMMYTVSYPASSGVHTRLARVGIESAANATPDSSYSIATYNGTAIEKSNAILLRDTGTHMDDPDLKNRWVCWEFSVDKSGGVGNVEVHLWVDGRDLRLSPAGSSSHGGTSASWDPIPFDLFMLGLDGWQDDEQPADYWIDDVLVTPERVGCPTAPSEDE